MARISKSNKNKKPEKQLEYKKCLKCTKEKRSDIHFYASYSPIHADGRCPVCKDCIKEMVDVNDVQSVKDVLRMMDRPFISEMWDSAVKEGTENNKDIFGLFVKNISMKDFRYLTWADSGEYTSQTTTINKNTQKQQIKTKNQTEVSEDLIEKWGEGYSPEEIRAFERKYKKLINNYGEKTALHTEGLITYIRYRVKEEMATARNEVKEAKEWGQLASKAAQDAKINVSQLSKSDISGGVDVLSQLFEAVETEVGIIPLLPQILEQPYDDADMIIWATVNYNRRLEDKPSVSYQDIWSFYDEMLGEYFNQQGFNEDQIKEFKQKRNNVFRDLSQVYREPLYESDGD